jgi:hypothetical protein
VILPGESTDPRPGFPQVEQYRRVICLCEDARLIVLHLGYFAMKTILGLFFLIVIAAALSNSFSNKPTAPTTTTTPSTSAAPQVYGPPTPPPSHPVEKLELVKTSWRIGGFGTVAIGDFTIKNSNSYRVKDFGIICEFYAKSGTKLGSGLAAIYDTIDAGKTRTFRDQNIGFVHSQSSGASCRLVSAARN